MATRKLTAELARRGLDRVAGDAASMGIFGDALLTSGEEDIGTILTARAVTMNRYSPLALVCDSLARVWNGEFDEAEKQFNQVVGLSAGEPTQRFAFAGLSLVATVREDWKSALHWAQVTHSITPGLSDGHTLRIAASAMLGQMDNARRYLGQFMAIAPGVSIRSIDDGQPYRNRSHLAPLLAALRLAGLPER